MRTAKDNENTIWWAIAPVAQASFVASGVHYMLANCVTGRAHMLLFTGGGVTFGVDVSVSKKLDYTSFKTRQPCNFNDFDGAAARLTGIKASIGIGYSKAYLTIWPDGPLSGNPLARITMGGWSLGKLSLSGQAAAYGIVGVHYGNGDPLGLVPRMLDVDTPIKPVEPEVYIQHKPHERPLLAVPGDALFDFDSDIIRRDAISYLDKATELIESRDRGNILIVGYTDSMGNSEYNKQLSLRRAKAVKQWFIQHKVRHAQGFLIKGYGEEKPIAPNTLPDGSDNPEGRAKNRRVEIHFTPGH